MLSFYIEGSILLMLICLLWVPFKIMDFVTPWTVACQTHLSMGFPRQEHLNGLPLPSAGDLPNKGSNLGLLQLLHWQADCLPLSHLGSPPILWIYPCWCF